MYLVSELQNNQELRKNIKEVSIFSLILARKCHPSQRETVQDDPGLERIPEVLEKGPKAYGLHCSQQVVNDI
jgi:hypothetical protein